MPLVRPTLASLIERRKADLASRLGTGPVLRRSVLGVLAEVTAGADHLMYGYLDYIARQLFPDSADDGNLGRWASIWGLGRVAASAAVGEVTFTGTTGVIIPAGTRLRRADGAEFATDAEATITGGSETVAVTAVSAGFAENTEAGAVLTMVNPIQSVQATVTVAAGGLAAGADEEGDDSLRARLLTRIRQPPHGGAAHDYEAWALEVSGVTRAWVYGNNQGPGTVGVAIVSDDDPEGPIPSGQKVEEVQAYIEARRPVTADVTVFAPEAAPIDMTITLSPDTGAVRAAVEAELRDMLKRDAAPGGTIYLSRIREAISVAAGESHHTLTVPSADVECDPGDFPTLGTITWGS